MRPPGSALTLTLALLSGCAVTGAADTGLHAGDADEIPWASDPDALARTAPGQAAAGLCADSETLAVLDSAQTAIGRYQVLDLYLALQTSMSTSLEGLVADSIWVGGWPDCLTFEQGDTLVVSSSEPCELYGDLSWTGTLVHDRGSTLTTLSYDALTVSHLDQTLTLDGRADELWGDSGFHWETNLRWSLPDDLYGELGVAGSSFAGLTGSSWSAWSTDPLFDEASGSGEQFLARSRLDETEASAERGLAEGTACGAASAASDALAIQGEVLWEFSWNADEGCYDTWRDGVDAGLFCWAETSYPAGPPRPGGA